MIDYLQKFNNLPKELRDKVASKKVMDLIHGLEAKYDTGLAAVVMKVMVKDLKVAELENYFAYDKGLKREQARQLAKEIKEQVFSEISNYLEYINKDKEHKQEAVNEGGDKKQKRQSSDFYFSIEDEEEVRKIAKDFSQFDRREVQNIQVEQKIDSILTQVGVIFSSDEMMGRLKKVLKTYLRGVRNKIDTKLALERGIDLGGLGLEEEISEDILKIVDLINKEELKKPPSAQKPKPFSLPEDKLEKSGAMSGDIPYEFKIRSDEEVASEGLSDGDDSNKDQILQPALHKVSDEKLEGFEDEYASDEEKEFKNKNSESVEEKPSGDYILDLTKDNDDEKGEEIEDDENNETEVVLRIQKDGGEENDKTQEAKTKNQEFEIPKSAMARSAGASDIKFSKANANTSLDTGKVRMDDIKHVAKLGGPVEELGAMSLVDFRRMGENANESIDKVRQLFLLLEDDSFSKKMLGIKAWRKSPLNKLYLKIGQESIVSKKDIASLIKDREEKGEETLSQAEFDVIMELNKELRY